MAVDPELKALLDALVEGQLKLAEGQARHGAEIQDLRRETAKLAAEQAKLAEEQAKLAEEQTKLTRAVASLTSRVEAFTEAVIRGFTDAASRHAELAGKMTGLDARVTALERQRDR